MVLVGATAAWGGVIKLRVTAEQANIREKPDIMSAILQQLPEGATLEAERKEGEWYAVLVEKEGGGFILGYVHESLVAAVEEAPPEPAPQKEPVEEVEPAVVKPAEEKKEEPRLLPPPVSPVPGEGEKRERWDVTLWLGGRHAAIGDLNDGAEGLARYYESRLAGASDGDVEALHFGYLLGAEARFLIAPRFYLSAGIEHSSGEATSSLAWDGGALKASYATKPWFRATPFSLALIYSPSPLFYLKAGLDYTLARCSYYYRYSSPDPFEDTELWQEWTSKASASGLGYQAGLGLDWPLGARVALIAEVAFRHCRLEDLEGEDDYREWTGYESLEQGTLYRIRASAGGAETFTLVFIRERKPSEAGVIDARKAELDLSGYSLKLGLRVRF